MALGKVNKFGTVFRFTVNMENLNFGSVNSPEIEMSNLKWKVKLCKQSMGGSKNSEALAIHLVSVFDDDSTKWSCDAQAAFKLLQKDGQADKSMVKYLSRKTFSNENSSHGIDDFIKWDNFLRQYVRENRAIFEIEITTSPLKRKRGTRNNMNEVSTKFHVAIEGVSELGAYLSPPMVLQGVRWIVWCRKTGEFLELDLSGHKDDMVTNWSYNVEATFNLLSFGSAQPVRRNLVCAFHNGKWKWDIETFLKWSDFVDASKEYIQQDEANLLVELKVEPRPMWQMQRQTLSTGNSSYK